MFKIAHFQNINFWQIETGSAVFILCDRMASQAIIQRSGTSRIEISGVPIPPFQA
jgi:hypothetical protein